MKNRKPTGSTSAVEMFGAAGTEEELASVSGQLAMFSLQENAPPGPKRFKSFHVLRVSARLCPNAAYNLAMFFDHSPVSRRRKRSALALRLYADVIDLGYGRMRDPAKPYDGTPRDEAGLRDIVSRAMTNVGSKISNSGNPERATQYFRDAIRIFPDNPVPHDCLGNMGVWHADLTGVSRIEGIAAWREAQRLGMWCHESEKGCPCKKNVIQIAERVLKSYGDKEADRWIERSAKIHVLGKRSNGDLKPVFRHGAEARKACKGRLTASGAEAADAFAAALKLFASRPLEEKVTIAATALGMIARVGFDQGILPSEIVEMTLDVIERAESLHPFLGDEEWLDLGPPRTMRLIENPVAEEIMEAASNVISSVMDSVKSLTAVDLAVGLMFNADSGFRNGIRAMIIDNVDRSEGQRFYMPAIYLGDARPSS